MGIWAKSCTTFQDWRETPVRIERNATILPILRVGAGDGDLMLVPVHMPVLDTQHLALTTTRFECSDETVVHRRADELVLGCVHLERCCQKGSLFLRSNSAVTFGFLLRFDTDAEPMERRGG